MTTATYSQLEVDGIGACIAADLPELSAWGKAEVTPRVAEGLFYLIGKRKSIGGRPVIIATNATKGDLAARLNTEITNRRQVDSPECASISLLEAPCELRSAPIPPEGQDSGKRRRRARSDL